MHAATVASTWDETPALRGIVLAGVDSLHAGHARPGQYLKVRADGHEGYFALANPPGAPFELLIKRGSPTGDALAALAPGAAVEVSEAQGKGFPVDDHAGHDLVLVAAGSGITPIRAVVEHVRAARDRWGRVTLFYGHARPWDFAYHAAHTGWAASGIELVKVVSRPDGGDHPGSHRTGYVQDALAAHTPSVDRAVALLCGMKPMVAAVTEALVAMGLPREHILVNF